MDSKKQGKKAHNAPPGYYTAMEAREVLGMSRAMFHRNTEKNGLQLHRYIPPGAKEGFYSKEEIDLVARLREQGLSENSKLPPTTFRQATAGDAYGITDCFRSLGWETVDPTLRIAWYEVNPEIDHVVLQGTMVMGFLGAAPYREPVMEQRLRGRLDSREVKPEDILPFEPGKSYALFVGLLERRKPADKPERYARYGLRLVLGFRRFLTENLRKRNIRIRYLLAHSAEDDGQHLADALGFVRQEFDPQREKYPIYILDMETSDAPWVKEYREAWEQKED